MEENKTIAALIDSYKESRSGKKPDIEKFDSQYNVEEHKIFKDIINFPDRTIEIDVLNENTQLYEKRSKRIPLNRIGLAYQKKINKIAATFFCGIPIKYSDEGKENTEEFTNVFLKSLDKVKSEFIDREVLLSVGRWTECAELWYNLEEENQYYGFKSDFSLRVKLLKPNEVNLYPEFDENNNMTRFSFGYEAKKEGKSVSIFRTYTAEKIVFYEETDSGWVSIRDVPNPIGKIPIVYYSQDATEWADVQTAIERLESIYSNTAESNDRFAFPILKIKGKVTGSLTQDRSGKVLELGGDGADANFVQSTEANASLTAEKETLEQDIHDFTSTPNISFDNMKGLGNILSGASAEFLFLSAHLKVKEKLAIYVPAFQRRVSICKSFLQIMQPKFSSEDLNLTPIITPYIVNNDADFYKMVMDINGNQPIWSHEESMRRANIKDPTAMIAQINKENKVRSENENSTDFNL